MNVNEDVDVIVKERVPRECDFCEDEATQRHTHIMRGGRTNPKSSAYQRDDCTWCNDAEVFTCDGCTKKGRKPFDILDEDLFDINGGSWCSTFKKDFFPGMFTTFIYREPTVDELWRAYQRREFAK